MVTDSIADALTRIRNGQIAGHKTVRVSISKLTKNVLEVLKASGFIAGFVEKPALPKKLKANSSGKTGASGRLLSKAAIAEKSLKALSFNEYEVKLKYYSNGEPAISFLRRVSTGGRRQYRGSDDLPVVKRHLGISIISTSQGVMSDGEARKRKIGGEVLALVS